MPTLHFTPDLPPPQIVARWDVDNLSSDYGGVLVMVVDVLIVLWFPLIASYVIPAWRPEASQDSASAASTADLARHWAGYTAAAAPADDATQCNVDWGAVCDVDWGDAPDEAGGSPTRTTTYRPGPADGDDAEVDGVRTRRSAGATVLDGAPSPRDAIAHMERATSGASVASSAGASSFAASDEFATPTGGGGGSIAAAVARVGDAAALLRRPPASYTGDDFQRLTLVLIFSRTGRHAFAPALATEFATENMLFLLDAARYADAASAAARALAVKSGAAPLLFLRAARRLAHVSNAYCRPGAEMQVNVSDAVATRVVAAAAAAAAWVAVAAPAMGSHGTAGSSHHEGREAAGSVGSFVDAIYAPSPANAGTGSLWFGGGGGGGTVRATARDRAAPPVGSYIFAYRVAPAPAGGRRPPGAADGYCEATPRGIVAPWSAPLSAATADAADETSRHGAAPTSRAAAVCSSATTLDLPSPTCPGARATADAVGIADDDDGAVVNVTAECGPGAHGGALAPQAGTPTPPLRLHVPPSLGGVTGPALHAQAQPLAGGVGAVAGTRRGGVAPLPPPPPPMDPSLLSLGQEQVLRLLSAGPVRRFVSARAFAACRDALLARLDEAAAGDSELDPDTGVRR